MKSPLNVVAWKVCFNAICLSKTEYRINHSSEKVKVVAIKHFVFCAIINYHFKTIELSIIEKLVEQTVQAFKSD